MATWQKALLIAAVVVLGIFALYLWFIFFVVDLFYMHPNIALVIVGCTGPSIVVGLTAFTIDTIVSHRKLKA